MKPSSRTAEGELRQIGAVLSRLAPDLLPDLAPMVEVLIESRSVIGATVWRARHAAKQTREQYARAHNIPVPTLIVVERWRNLTEGELDVRL